ncbi:hypothetical protein ACFLRN_10880 [Thermoproteota archaeon]
MDLTTRGIISSIINNNYESQKVLKTIKWILEIDDEVYCKEDLALGYFMGTLVQISSNSTSMMKRNALIDEQYRKSLEKIYGGKEGKIQYLEYKMKTEELAKKENVLTIIIEASEEEIEEIRKMLIPMISGFKEKIRQEVELERI